MRFDPLQESKSCVARVSQPKLISRLPAPCQGSGCVNPLLRVGIPLVTSATERTTACLCGSGLLQKAQGGFPANDANPPPCGCTKSISQRSEAWLLVGPLWFQHVSTTVSRWCRRSSIVGSAISVSLGWFGEMIRVQK